jgi:hypothetical protein
MSFTHEDKQEIKELIAETVSEFVFKSHRAISEHTSQTGSDIARIKDHIANIDKENIARNGSFAKAVEKFDCDINDLKTAKSNMIVGVSILSAIISLLVIPVVGYFAYSHIVLANELSAHIGQNINK